MTPVQFSAVISSRFPVAVSFVFRRRRILETQSSKSALYGSDCPSIKVVNAVRITVLLPDGPMHMPERCTYGVHSGFTVPEVYDAGLSFLQKDVEYIDIVQLFKGPADFLNYFRC